MALRQILDGLFVNEIPLPKSPLKGLNSYILVSEERNLIIDTGFNLEPCQEALLQGIEDLRLDLQRTDLLLTHMHPDHSGLADELRDRGCRVYMSARDGEILNAFRRSGGLIYERLYDALGLGKESMVKVGSEVFGKHYTEPFEFVPVKEGDEFHVGNFTLKVIEVPGHTPGQVNLYEPRHKILFSGDHILDEISPNITFWSYDFDSLGTYMGSLQKVAAMDVALVLPAHRRAIADHRSRIAELVCHHEERLREVARILQEGKMTAAQVAAQMQWDVKFDSWEDFPKRQKWFAVGEAMSHLEHLVFCGKARRTVEERKTFYELC